jgi:hypothetical protein
VLSGDDCAPRHDQVHLPSLLELNPFGMSCICTAEFIAANEDILTEVYSVLVKRVSGLAKIRRSCGVISPRE